MAEDEGIFPFSKSFFVFSESLEKVLDEEVRAEDCMDCPKAGGVFNPNIGGDFSPEAADDIANIGLWGNKTYNQQQ